MKTCGLDVHKDMIFCAIFDGKVWIAPLMYNGMLNDSFIPNGALSQLRVYTATIAAPSRARLYADADRPASGRHGHKAEQLPEQDYDDEFPPSGGGSGWRGDRPCGSRESGPCYAMLKNHEQYCLQKTRRTLTASQLERVLKLRAKQYSMLCLQVSQAGVSAEKLTEISIS